MGKDIAVDALLSAPPHSEQAVEIRCRRLRVAIVHYWLVTMRGGEKVLESLCRMFPQADIFTHAYAPQSVSPTIRRHNVRTSFIGRLPHATQLYKSYLPLMPLALEQLDLRGYDLVISSESGPAKGVIPPATAVHLCYCHSPMRYVWNMYHDYRDNAGPVTRFAMVPLVHYVRNWDVLSSSRVDHFIANSENVRSRLQRYYRRDAQVVHPPVEVNAFQAVPREEHGNYYLMVGELVRYKRPDLAVAAFNRLRQPLVIIGGGEMLADISRLAGPTVTVLGPQPFDVLRLHYARCRGLVFPGEEDFGIVPVEAMASGRPVLAYRAGGALETVIDGLSGLFFDEQSEDAIIDGIERLDRLPVDQARIQAHARRFAEPIFRQKMWDVLSEALNDI